jgi:hypothetical protein
MRYISQVAVPSTTPDTASYTSPKISPAQWIQLSFLSYFSENTAAGTIQIQFSNDPLAGQSEENFVPLNWANVPGSIATATVVAGASVAVYLPENFCGRWYRIVFTRTGGVGTFGVNYCAVSL